MAGVADVVSRVSDTCFGKPLVTNVLRGHVAEAIVALALEPEWAWCSADYAAWDFQRGDLKLEVKQSALRQSWQANPATKARPSFDIRERTGQWEGANWVHGAGRFANLYVFCWHGRADPLAEHRDPTQWEFFVVQTTDLPPSKRIGLRTIQRLTKACSVSELRTRVDRVAAEIQ